MDPLTLVEDLLAKVVPLGVEAIMAAQAGDVARHKQAVEALDSALAEARTSLGTMAADHEATMATARAKVAARFLSASG